MRLFSPEVPVKAVVKVVAPTLSLKTKKLLSVPIVAPLAALDVATVSPRASVTRPVSALTDCRW